MKNIPPYFCSPQLRWKDEAYIHQDVRLLVSASLQVNRDSGYPKAATPVCMHRLRARFSSAEAYLDDQDVE